MSGIGWTEFFLIALILLIFVGPQRLPELFGKVAWMVAQLRSASRDLRNQIDDELAEIRQVKSDFTEEMKAETDKLYAEARKVDDEYRSLQEDLLDDMNEMRAGLNKDEMPEQRLPDDKDANSTFRDDSSVDATGSDATNDDATLASDVKEDASTHVVQKELKG